MSKRRSWYQSFSSPSKIRQQSPPLPPLSSFAIVSFFYSFQVSITCTLEKTEDFLQNYFFWKMKFDAWRKHDITAKIWPYLRVYGYTSWWIHGFKDFKIMGCESNLIGKISSTQIYISFFPSTKRVFFGRWRFYNLSLKLACV